MCRAHRRFRSDLRGDRTQPRHPPRLQARRVAAPRAVRHHEDLMRRKLLWAAALLYSLAHFDVTGLPQPLQNFYGDFLASFPPRRLAMLAGRLDLWTGTLAQQWTHMWSWGHPDIWYYGPLEHLIAAPLLAFPSLRSAYIAWLFVNLIFVAITMAIAAKVVDDALVVIVAFLNFNPLYEALTQRTIEIFELLLLFAACARCRRGRDGACGAALGAAAMAKFLPIAYLPWLVLKRKWRARIAAPSGDRTLGIP